MLNCNLFRKLIDMKSSVNTRLLISQKLLELKCLKSFSKRMLNVETSVNRICHETKSLTKKRGGGRNFFNFKLCIVGSGKKF